MSIPAFAWAFEQGRVLGLPVSDRIVLVYLADLANGARLAWPGQEKIADNTGLTTRAVRTVTDRLEAAGLIRVETRGRSRLYHILRPINGEDHIPAAALSADKTPEARSAMTAEAGSRIPEARSAIVRRTPEAGVATPEAGSKIPEARSADSLKNQVKNQEARVPAREPSVSENLSVGRKSMPAPPALQQAEPDEREPTPAEIQAMRQRQLEDIAAMPPQVAAAVRSLANAFESGYHGPGRWPERDRDAQRDAVAPVRPKTAHAPPEMLAMLRQRAGYGSPVPASSRALA